uniref:NADH dehydrogenase subunit 6 n=1 Tax=Arion flagellus TaxID=236857 RepID=UPI0024101788|nr:NADH dehydrogenase subunit 6 [Arion flagellus]WES82232.1 NADH dehydrogenase subunit 6 [Arion flagellus]
MTMMNNMLYTSLLIFFMVLIYWSPMTPFSVGLILFFVSLYYTIYYSWLFNSWYSMILFMVYIGGLLVLMMYTTLTSSNFSSSSSLNMWSWSVMLILSMSLSSVIWLEFSEEAMNFSQAAQQGSAFNPLFILFLGILLFYIFLMVVFIVTTSGKSLQIVTP